MSARREAPNRGLPHKRKPKRDFAVRDRRPNSDIPSQGSTRVGGIVTAESFREGMRARDSYERRTSALVVEGTVTESQVRVRTNNPDRLPMRFALYMYAFMAVTLAIGYAQKEWQLNQAPRAAGRINRGENFTAGQGAVITGDLRSAILWDYFGLPQHDKGLERTGEVYVVLDAPARFNAPYGAHLEYPKPDETVQDLVTRKVVEMRNPDNCVGGCVQVNIHTDRAKLSYNQPAAVIFGGGSIPKEIFDPKLKQGS